MSDERLKGQLQGPKRHDGEFEPELSVSTVRMFREVLSQREDRGHDCLYREQADAAWPVDCSAVRRIKRQFPDVADPLMYFPMMAYVSHLLDDVRTTMQLGPISPPDLDLLAQLQHHGAATNLIDFTTNPLVALWFACNDLDDKDGMVHAVRKADAREVTSPAAGADAVRRVHVGDGEPPLWRWRPASVGLPRVEQQESVFVFGAPFIWKHRRRAIRVMADAKQKILEELRQLGIDQFRLFPDFPGVAAAHASTAPMSKTSLLDFWRRHLATARDGRLGTSVERESLDYLGFAHSAIGESEEAIKRYTESLGLEETAHSYNSRGVERRRTGDTEGALDDFTKAIELDPQSAQAHMNRGNLLLKLGRETEGFEDVNRALKLGFKLYYDAVAGRVSRYPPGAR